MRGFVKWLMSMALGLGIGYAALSGITGTDPLGAYNHTQTTVIVPQAQTQSQEEVCVPDPNTWFNDCTILDTTEVQDGR